MHNQPIAANEPRLIGPAKQLESKEFPLPLQPYKAYTQYETLQSANNATPGTNQTDESHSRLRFMKDSIEDNI
jgi:hypothetical protein